MNGLYKTSIQYTKNRKIFPATEYKIPLQLFVANLSEGYVKKNKKNNVIDYTANGTFTLDNVNGDYRNPKITISNNSEVILKTETKGFLNGLTIMFKSCNCASKSGELYIVKFEYIGDVNEEPVYSVRPTKF